jgi:hypothetical protein
VKIAHKQERRELLGALGYYARQLDIRAIEKFRLKFRLETIEPNNSASNEK